MSRKKTAQQLLRDLANLPDEEQAIFWRAIGGDDLSSEDVRAKLQKAWEAGRNCETLPLSATDAERDIWNNGIDAEVQTVRAKVNGALLRESEKSQWCPASKLVDDKLYLTPRDVIRECERREIRMKHPTKRDGTENKQRRLVHLGDWEQRANKPRMEELTQEQIAAAKARLRSERH